MENRMLKAEGGLRVFALVFLVLTACLVRLDTETKVIFISRKATYKDMKPLVILVIVEFAAAGFHLLQLSKCLILGSVGGKTSGSYSNIIAWFSFLLDQMVTYVSFGAFTAVSQAAALAITGESDFEWIKLCERYTRFCYQIRGALFCGIVALVVMAVITSISAFNLFRLYSHKHFLILLKGR